MNLSIDPNEFRAVIDAAVDAAIRRHMDSRPRDEVGRLLVSKRDAADVLSMSVSSLDRITYPRGSLRAVRLDGRVLYSPKTLRAWIASREAEGGKA